MPKEHRHGYDKAYLLPRGMPKNIEKYSDRAIHHCLKPTFFDDFVERATLYEYTPDQMSQILLFEKAKMISPVIDCTKTLYSIKPPKSAPEQKTGFLQKVDDEYVKIENLAIKKAMQLGTSSDMLVPNNVDSHIFDEEQTIKFKKLLSQSGFRIPNERKIKQVHWIFESINNMSRLFIELSLGDIGNITHKFDTHSPLYLALMAYLEYGYFSATEALHTCDASVMGRLLWSLEQQQSLPKSAQDTSEKAFEMTRYGLLLTILQDHLYRKTIYNLMQEELDYFQAKGLVVEETPLFIFEDVLSIAQIRLDELLEIIHPPDEKVLSLRPSINKQEDAPLYISAIRDTQFGKWLFSRLNSEFIKSLPIEIGQKSILNMVLQYLHPGLSYRDKIKKISSEKGAPQDINELYDCEVIPTLFAMICEQHPQIAIDPNNFAASTEAFRARIYVQPNELESIIEALNRDDFPEIKAGLNDVQKTEQSSPPVYLFTDYGNGHTKVVPINKDTPFTGNINLMIKDAFKQNLFASIFVHYTIPNTFIGPVTVELQILPESIQEQYYSSQRKSFLKQRIGNNVI